MIIRFDDMERLQAAVKRSRVVLLTGARQVGKTTLARQLVPRESAQYFDLEDPNDLARLKEPMTALAPLEGLVVIDEVQQKPELFSILRVLADRTPLPARFLVLGSASPEALRQTSQSLAGRITYLELSGLGVREAGIEQLDRLWLRGGFPESFLADSDGDSWEWRRGYLQSLTNRDLPGFGLRLPATSIHGLLTLIAHSHGQTWNGAQAARHLEISVPSVRRYIDTLADALLVRVLQPWSENIGKRQVKSPRAYLRDSGIAHHLLGITDAASLLRDPHAGATWEGMIIEECIRRMPHASAYFWRTAQGAELDLLLVTGNRRIGVEIKRSDAPRLTPSMRAAKADLRLDRLIVVFPGAHAYRLADGIDAVPVAQALAEPSSLAGHSSA